MTFAICGSTAKSTGKPCQQSAGWGTDHPGVHHCKLHGGCSPSGRKAAAKAGALVFARGALGAEADSNPLEAALQAVGLAGGIREWYQAQIAACNGGPIPPAIVDGFERAVERQAKISVMAATAGVSERQVRIVERIGNRLTLALDVALGRLAAAGLTISPAQRAEAVEGFVNELMLLEQVDGD